MIANHETHAERMDIWSKLSALLPSAVISWRQDGKPVQRDGKYVARFVAYIEANTVRERLDSVVPGEWDLTLDLLPTHGADANDDGEPVVSFKARLQILGVIREDVGTGRDYKSAATDAFKRAAVRFGVAHELYAFEQNWVQVDGDGRYAKPLEDPATVYARRQARAESRERLKLENGNTNGNGNGGGAQAPASQHGSSAARSGAAAPSHPAHREPEEGDVIPDGSGDPMVVGEPSCPKCGGRMFDNVAENNLRAQRGEKLRPDHKCRNRACDGVIWRDANKKKSGAAPKAKSPHDIGDIHGLDDDDEIPF